MKAVARAAPDGGSFTAINGWRIDWRNGTALQSSPRLPFSQWPERQATADEIALAKQADEKLWAGRIWPLPFGLKAEASST